MFLIFSMLVFVIGALTVGYVISTEAFFASIVFAALIVVCIIAELISSKNRRFCKRCKRKYNFEEDVSYKQIGHSVKTYPFNTSRNTTKQLRSRELFKVAITCECPQCGNTKQFKGEWAGRETYYDGSIHDSDPNQEIEKFFQKGSFVGNIKMGLIMLGVGLLMIIVGVSMFLEARSVVSNSDDDPKDYYGIYYAVDDNGVFYEIELKKNSKYEFTTKNIFGEIAEYEQGTYYYKDKEDANGILSDAKYTNKELLLLETGEDLYISVWVIRSGQKITLEMNAKNVTLTTKEITPNDVTEDPKNYYGVYYGIDEEKFMQYIVTVDETEVIIFSTNNLASETQKGSYQYLAGSIVSAALDDPKYANKNALLCRTGKNNQVVVIWFLTEGDEVTLEFNEIDVTLTSEERSLADCMNDPGNHRGTYIFNSNNSLSLTPSGYATLKLNGSTKEYRYFYANSAYLQKIFSMGGKENSIVVYEPGKTSGYIFEIVEGGLLFNGSFFEKMY